jgi:hypothetical protein
MHYLYSLLIQVSQLVPHIITRDVGQQPPLSEFCGPQRARDFLLVLQGDAARRGSKLFSQWVFKNVYIESQVKYTPLLVLLLLLLLLLPLSTTTSTAAAAAAAAATTTTILLLHAAAAAAAAAAFTAGAASTCVAITCRRRACCTSSPSAYA